MKTYFIATTKYEPGRNFFGMTITSDFVVFDDIQQLEIFMAGESAVDAKDDFATLQKNESVNRVFCILAPNFVRATERAYQLKSR